MSFTSRMTRDVGDRDPVWRYLLEKVAHTALITVALHACSVQLFRAACIAAAIYLLASKIVVRVQQHDWATFWREGAFYRRLVFIAVLLSLIPALASADVYGRTRMLEALGGWLAAFLLLDHFEWEGI